CPKAGAPPAWPRSFRRKIGSQAAGLRQSSPAEMWIASCSRRSCVGRVLLLTLVAALLPAQPKPEYEILAIRYATIPQFAVSGLVAGADPARKLDIAMMVWLVRGNGKNILVDAGFYREQFFKQWEIADFAKPPDAVARAGVKPDEITDVIVTHMHWD